jgi:hypothetical protein
MVIETKKFDDLLQIKKKLLANKGFSVGCPGWIGFAEPEKSSCSTRP